MPQEIGTVRGHVHHQPVIGERHGFEQRRARRGLGVELEDAVVLLAQPELPGGAEHALGDFAPQLGSLDRHRLAAFAVRHRRADPGERIPLPRRHVGSTADDMAALGRAVVHQADPQPVGVGMLAHLFHQADHEAGQIGVQRLDRIDRPAEHGEPVGRVLGIQRTAEEGLEPAQGDIHPPCPATLSRNRISPSSSSRISGIP